MIGDVLGPPCVNVLGGGNDKMFGNPGNDFSDGDQIGVLSGINTLVGGFGADVCVNGENNISCNP